MNSLTKCLDHGFVRLVSYTQPVKHDISASPTDDVSYWTGDLEVLRNARVSYNAEFRTGDDAGKDQKLINYLYANKHTSPFEAMVFTFEVKAPIFVVRQWHRHRTWSYNEVSARYTELPEEFYVPEKLLRQAQGNKQMSSDEIIPEQMNLLSDMRDINESAFTVYRNLIDRGVSRELARTVLPLATYTRMFCTVDLHNLLHFIRSRDHAHAQPEIQVYAKALKDLIQPIVPFTVEAFDGTN